MKFHFLLVVFSFVNLLFGQDSIKLMSWNLLNFGQSKDEQTISFVANIMKDYDIVAIQEIVASSHGAQAIARLADELNRKGKKWDYAVSNPTSGKNSSERYAYLWQTSKVKLKNHTWLEPSLSSTIEREPFMAKFQWKDSTLLIANFHAVPAKKDPAEEINLLDTLLSLYPNQNLILLGDFNLSAQNRAFNRLKAKGMQACLENTKTTIKMNPDKKTGEHLANAYDNILYKKNLRVKHCNSIDFTKTFKSLQEARKVSDHLPIFIILNY